MPFIRDYAYIANAAASNSVVVPMPSYVQNDLLLALISADGGMTGTTAPNTTASGWIVLGYWAPSAASTSTVGMVLMGKYAAASESDTTFTLTSATADTANGTIISIGDAFYDGISPANAIDQKTANVNATAKWTSARGGYPLLTTTLADELILYFGVAAGTGVTGVCSILEGPCHKLIGKDGNAHNDGIGWAFKKSAGAIAANSVYAQVVGTASAAGYLAQISIKPPSGGAQVIPTYIQTDNCKLINIGTGQAHSTVYGNSSATTANSTQFPTASLTLNGRPVIASGATYTYTDQGLNTFHSGLGILGITTSNSWASNSTAHAAMTDLAGENILLHVSPQLPIDIQTTDSAALSGACGLAVGLASTAGNCKVWHVHGSGTAWDAARYVPVVINTSNTSGVIGSVGTINTASITLLGMFLSCKSVAAKWTVASIWKLASTIFCGGNAASPMTIDAIYDRVYIGKERRSLMFQGASQIVVFQPIQIGNGAVDPVYADLGGVAFEFPAQYNKSKKQINYCSIDNKTGFTIYTGAGDILDLRSAVFSSPNKYVWGFNAAAAGTVYTDGMQVVGAGTITFCNGINITSALFSKCDQITAATNVLTSVSFDTSNATTGAISITGATQSELQAALDKFVSCTWSNNTVGLRIIYSGAGNITLNMSSGNFSGNTKDIRWEAGAERALTINISGSCNVSTGETNNSTAIIFSNPKTKTFTNIPNGAEVRIRQGAYTLAYQDNITTGSYQYNYQYVADKEAKVVVTLAGYIIDSIDFVLDNTSSSIGIVYSPDPSYTVV